MIVFPFPGRPELSGHGDRIDLDEAAQFAELRRNLPLVESQTFVHFGRPMTAAEVLAEIESDRLIADALIELAAQKGVH